MPVCTSSQCPISGAWITQKAMPAIAAPMSPTVTMGRHHFTPLTSSSGSARGSSSGSVLQDLAYGVPGPAQLDAHHDLRHAVDDAEQPEQQCESDRADARAGEQHD